MRFLHDKFLSPFSFNPCAFSWESWHDSSRDSWAIVDLEKCLLLCLELKLFLLPLVAGALHISVVSECALHQTETFSPVRLVVSLRCLTAVRLSEPQGVLLIGRGVWCAQSIGLSGCVRNKWTHFDYRKPRSYFLSNCTQFSSSSFEFIQFHTSVWNFVDYKIENLIKINKNLKS